VVKGVRPSRADYYRALAKALPADALVVTALGNASYLWAAIHHVPENFYIEDSMGLALPLALGLALAQPARPVLVVEGDGATLMHMGALVTVGAVRPKNLTILLVANGVHAASGGQQLTNASLDFAEIARAAGIRRAKTLSTPNELAANLNSAHEGPQVLALLTAPDIEVVRPPIVFDPVLAKQRFMSAIGAPRYIPTLFGGGRLEREGGAQRAP
jgi:sulfopyruvate decarboxylase subunit beta